MQLEPSDEGQHSPHVKIWIPKAHTHAQTHIHSQTCSPPTYYTPLWGDGVRLTFMTMLQGLVILLPYQRDFPVWSGNSVIVVLQSCDCWMTSAGWLASIPSLWPMVDASIEATFTTINYKGQKDKIRYCDLILWPFDLKICMVLVLTKTINCGVIFLAVVVGEEKR